MKPHKTPPTRGLVAVAWHALFGFWSSSNLVQRCLIVAIGVWSINAVVWILVLIKTLHKVLGGQQ
jgi:hypothetical protein